MTTTRFIPLSANETLKDYPQYFREDITCFLILKDQPHDSGKLVGLYGLIDRGVEKSQSGNDRIGEAFLTIFPAFRYRTLSKGFFLNLFDHAFDSGFDKVYTWTRLPSWQKVLGRFEVLGIHRLETSPPWDLHPPDLDPPNLDSPDSGPKVWFVKETGKEF